MKFVGCVRYLVARISLILSISLFLSISLVRSLFFVSILIEILLKVSLGRRCGVWPGLNKIIISYIERRWHEANARKFKLKTCWNNNYLIMGTSSCPQFRPHWLRFSLSFSLFCTSSVPTRKVNESALRYHCEFRYSVLQWNIFYCTVENKFVEQSSLYTSQIIWDRIWKRQTE